MKIKKLNPCLLLFFQIYIVDAVPNGVAGPLTGKVQTDGELCGSMQHLLL